MPASRTNGCPARPWGPILWGLVVALAAPFVAQGQAPGPWALPATGDVPSASLGGRGVTLGASLGAGFTESLRGTASLPVPEGQHLRLDGSVAAAMRALPWLAVAVRLDGRYDRHPRDAQGADDGWTGMPWLLIRGAWAAGPGRLAAELRWGVPGWDAPDVRPDASVLEGRLAYGWSSCASCLELTASAGYRLDGSAQAVPDPGQLRPGDLSALQASDFDAVLLGLSARLPLGRGEAWAALWAEAMLGADAPGPLQSPAAVALGYRHALGGRLWLLSGLVVRPTRAPRLDPDALAPIWPRLRAWVGLAVDLAPAPADQAARRSASTPSTTPEQPARPTPLVLRIAGRDGAPLAEASVTLLDAEGEVLREARTDERGEARLPLEPDWQIDRLRLRVEAEVHQPVEQPLDAARASEPLAVTLEPVPRKGELRGLVRSFSGRPLPAVVRVEPGGIEVRVDEEGRFELPLEAGDYEVEIEAPGYRPQRRRVHVETDGVTVLNAELRRASRR